MSPENFVYWLQGYLEINENAITPVSALSPQQVQVIKDHLNLVFNKITPPKPTNIIPLNLNKELDCSSINKIEYCGDAHDRTRPLC